MYTICANVKHSEKKKCFKLGGRGGGGSASLCDKFGGAEAPSPLPYLLFSPLFSQQHNC